MRTIASRQFRIWGSGTSFTWTLRLPIQQSALIGISPWNLASKRSRRCREPFAIHRRSSPSADRLGWRLGRMRAAMDGCLGDNHFAGLQHLLELAKVAGDLLAWTLPE